MVQTENKQLQNNMNPLLAISTIDGRYCEDTKELTGFFSETALFKYRVLVEIEYLILLSSALKLKPVLSTDKIKALRNLYQNFSEKDILEIKTIEEKTKHDIKAVEYFIKNKLKNNNLEAYSSFVHFALTSEDINNLAYHLMWQDAIKNIYLPSIIILKNGLKKLSKKYAVIPLLSLTHGQSATPTTVGKEINVFATRLDRQITQLQRHKLTGKLNGATGTFGAHTIAYPEVNWLSFSHKFVTSLGLEPNLVTTQVEPNDSLAESYQNIFRVNTILIDLCRDFWLYISRGIFIQQKKDGEVGSSTMPHKINPIQFENAEGNLGLANAYFNHLAGTLPISRLQRDLSNSTVIRNQGVPLAHSVLSIKQIVKGLDRLQINLEKVNSELNDHWEILSEAIQTVFRKYNDDTAYEKMKALTQGQKIDKQSLKKIINESKLPTKEKSKLLLLTPKTYIGLAEKLARL